MTEQFDWISDLDGSVSTYSDREKIRENIANMHLISDWDALDLLDAQVAAARAGIDAEIKVFLIKEKHGIPSDNDLKWFRRAQYALSMMDHAAYRIRARKAFLGRTSKAQKKLARYKTVVEIIEARRLLPPECMKSIFEEVRLMLRNDKTE